jgi:hypothetical protein
MYGIMPPSAVPQPAAARPSSWFPTRENAAQLLSLTLESLIARVRMPRAPPPRGCAPERSRIKRADTDSDNFILNVAEAQLACELADRHSNARRPLSAPCPNDPMHNGADPARLDRTGRHIMKRVLAPVLAATYFTFTACMPVAMHAQSAGPGSSPRESGTTEGGLEGTWVNSWGTPLERPGILNGKASFTDEEVAALRERSKAIFSKAQSDAPVGDTFLVGVLTSPDVFKNPNATNNALDVDIPDIDNRTSLIIDPPDGRLPEYTPAGTTRNAARLRAQVESMPTDPEAMGNPYRCLSYGTPRLLRGMLSLMQIVVTQDFVVFDQEWIHETRIVPLDGRPHLPAGVRRWAGDPRGHWEGKTLVVETTNFPRQNNVVGSDENLELVERLRESGPMTSSTSSPS